MPDFDLTGQVAFVTGAGSGLGAAIALAYAEHGADVACFDRAGSAGALDVAERIRKLGRRTLVLAGDVRVTTDIEAALDRVEATLGPLTLAANSAGIANAAPAEAMPDDQLLAMIDINLTGTFRCCRAEGRRMLARGRGSILNMASICGSTAIRGLTQAHYDMAKAGVVRLTQSLAMEWAGRGVRVNCLSPGFMATPMNLRAEVADEARAFAMMTPMGRMGQAAEVGGPAVFLASAAASYCTGVDLNVDGGFLTC